MKKKFFILFITVLLLSGCKQVPKLANGEEAVVSFTDSELSISANDLYDELINRYGIAMVIDMIDQKILEEEYSDKLEEARTSATNEIDGLKTVFVDEDGNYDEASLKSTISNYYGFDSIEEYEKMLYINFLRNLAIEDYAREQITDDEIQDYYTNEFKGDIEASHILIKSSASSSATDEEKTVAETEALNEAKDIIRQLQDGADFAELAREHSDDTANASEGGALGYFSQGEMEDEFEEAAFALRVNRFTTTPVQTQYGYHIILKTGEREKPSLEDARDTIIDRLTTKLIADDASISINAIINLRESFGIKINDSNLNSQYQTLINNQLLNAQFNS